MEILAPVGGREQLLAAVRSGANAVYLGTKSFNARRSAENFDSLSLGETVAYCHGRGVAVHVTLNTLLLDGEIPRLLEEIEQIAHSGADAVIIQDLGVAALVRRCCPTLAMHASTQLSVHSVSGALFMRALGFSRLVLARELTGEEIKQIKEQSGLAVEVFVHGALCMSMSGSCYLSSLLGERSGNRGLCAQPCRLNFVNPHGREYALSLKDLTLIGRLEELRAAGVDSLKIEGRMKRPEYVAAAVSACREALGGQQPDMERLQAVFSRSGFTDGYFTGRRDTGLFGYRRREDVTAAAGVLGELASSYRGENPLIPIAMSLVLERDFPLQLTLDDGEFRVTVQGEKPQQAQNRPTDLTLVRRGLEKLGGTPFYLRELTAELGEGLMVPMSALNALRKEGAERLLALRETAQPHRFTLPRADSLEHPARQAPPSPALHLRLERWEQLTPALEKSDATLITLPLWELYSHQELIPRLGDRLAAELPMLIFPKNEQTTREQLLELQGLGLTSVVAGSPGALQLAATLLRYAPKSAPAGRPVQAAVPTHLRGDYSLNILNSHALKAYADLGLTEATVSFESSMRGARELGGYLPVGVLGYGHLPVMTFRACPAQGAQGCGDCTGVSRIADRKGNQFPLLCRQREYSQLLNPIPLYLGDRQEVLEGLSFVTLYFTTEPPGQCDRVLSLWQERQPYPGQRTGALYFRELL